MRDVMKRLPGYALKRAAAAMQAEFAERLAPLELRPSDAAVILQAAANPGITQSELGHNLAIQRANMAPLIARLAAMGLFDRTARDGRSHGLVLTAKGNAMLTEVRRIVDAHEDALLARIPPEHRPHVLPALSALW